MTMRLLGLTLFLAATLGSTAEAQDANVEIHTLREQLIALSQRLDDLEASNRELKKANEQLQESGQKTADFAKQASEQSSGASWTDRIKIKGDFRMRYESIDEQNKADRNRTRIRSRASIIAQVSDDVEVGIGMASGGDDPVSTNQTLGGGGSTKGLNLDLAYFKWKGTENTTVMGGKMNNILYKPGKNALLWDGDWNPEGTALEWSNGDYFANALGTWLESDSKNKTEFSYAIQTGITKSTANGSKLTAGIGYYHLGTAGKSTFFGGDDEFFGNSFDPVTQTYLYDYQIVELFADFGFELADRPASVFVDLIRNQDAPMFDSGFAAGFTYGSAKKEKDWEFGYTYQDLEADAAFGLLTDSDFGGGGTDVSGHILKYGFAIQKNWVFNVTYLINEAGKNAGNRRDYDRLQVDLAFKY